MELNKGWSMGAIGIPNDGEKMQVVKYYVKAGKRKSKYGIDGGKITGLILNTNSDTLAYYAGEKGWIKKPEGRAAEMAFEILLYEHN